ncbi:MAG: PilN domain-containing protein [Candidatus Paceibacterota bacterium]|jgi:hypothetical protein|nr:PilN domain-containing protein [Candidatus Paceibacterota bacterium]
MINLLPFEEKKKIRTDYYWRVVSVCLPLSAGVLSVAIVSLFPSYYFAQVSNKNTLKESQSAEAVSKKTQADEMKQAVLDANKKISLLKEPIAKNNAGAIFDEILKARPEGVSIAGYDYRTIAAGRKKTDPTTTIVLQGVSEGREVIQTFVRLLRKNNNFESVDLPISSLISESNFPYSINIVVKSSI